MSDVSIKGAYQNIHKCWSMFEHRGKKMTRQQVESVLRYGLQNKYETVNQIPDHIIDKIIGVSNQTTS